jgi:hypothetical protein
MSDTHHLSHPQDICLLLRTHGEQRWLLSELLPVLRQVETPGAVPEDQLGAALAYLELLWLDATRRARETDAAYANLRDDDIQHDQLLYEKARRYHAALCRMRTTIERRLIACTRLPNGHLGHEHASL